MKKVMAVILISCLFLTACSSVTNPDLPESDITSVTILNTENSNKTNEFSEDSSINETELGETQSTESVDSEVLVDISGASVESGEISFDGMTDPNLITSFRDSVYLSLLNCYESEKIAITDIECAYISQEFIDELRYNTRSNIYFGRTKAELDELFEGTSYTFTLGENNETIVEELRAIDDDAYNQLLLNVAIGGGVIVVLVVVTVLTEGATAPTTVTVIHAFAESMAGEAISYAATSGLSMGLVEVISSVANGEDTKTVLKSGALAASEGFRNGAIIGALTGGFKEGVYLGKGMQGGLSIKEVAAIQKESSYPLELISKFHSKEEYEAFKAYGLKVSKVNGKLALIRDIDPFYKDANGLTNYERMLKGLSALDPSTGQAYELHHIGQSNNSPLAILTKEEHTGGGNFKILHEILDDSPVSHGADWNKTREEFWKAMAKLYEGVMK